MSQLIVYNSNTDFSVTSNVLDADINTLLHYITSILLLGVAIWVYMWFAEMEIPI